MCRFTSTYMHIYMLNNSERHNDKDARGKTQEDFFNNRFTSHFIAIYRHLAFPGSVSLCQITHESKTPPGLKDSDIIHKIFFLSTSFNSSIFLCPLRWCRVVMLKAAVYGNQVHFESLKNSAGMCTESELMLYSYLHVHPSQRHNIKDRRMRENAGRLL